jgi:hypothetical protein
MTNFLIRLANRTTEHDTMTVFVGSDKDHRAYCGQLTMRSNEATAFRSAMASGQGDLIGPDGVSVEFGEVLP